MGKTAKWQDWTSFALGLWLAVSPWAAGYEQVASATGNAAFVGVALALLAHFEVGLDEANVEWLNLVLALWLLAAPFALEFLSSPVATANTLLVGAFAALLALSALGLDKALVRRWQERSPLIRH